MVWVDAVHVIRCVEEHDDLRLSSSFTKSVGTHAKREHSKTKVLQVQNEKERTQIQN